MKPEDLQIKADLKVLVTGAAGFIGSHVVQQLLLAGYRIRGTIRSLDNQYQVDALNNLVPDSKHKLQLVQADLKQDQGWDEAVEGCYAVLHLAGLHTCNSFYPPLEEFVEVAEQGTLRVMRAAAKAGVKKFVLAGDFASVIGDPKPLTEKKAYSEEDWMEINYPNIDRYTKSKCLAERAAWNFVENQPASNKLQLTVLLQCDTLGPPLLKLREIKGWVDSMQVIMKGSVPGCVRARLHFSDVRELASVYLQCLTKEEVIGKRIIIGTQSMWTNNINKLLSNEFRPQGYNYIYTNNLSFIMLKISSFFVKSIDLGALIQKIDKDIRIDTGRMHELFSIRERKMEDTIIDMMYAMIDVGITHKASKYKQVGSRANKSIQK